MYIPSHFREDDPQTLYALMQEYSFATLVTQSEGAPFASHLPFLFDAERGERGVLSAHMARANPQWRHLEAGDEAVVIFQGPHAYISPSWYEVQPSVPTWNYTAVHAYGTPSLLDRAATREILRRTVAIYEAGQERPWRMETLTEEYVEKMLNGLVGFEIAVTRLEGKAKLGQNRSTADQTSVIAALEQAGDPLAVATAALMRQTVSKGGVG